MSRRFGAVPTNETEVDAFGTPAGGWDAVVDSAAINVGSGNVYATLQAAITAGHKSIFVRSMGDAVDITIAAGDAVNRITGVDALATISPVNITVNKVGLLLEYMQFSAKTLLLGTSLVTTFACSFLNTGVLEVRGDDCQVIQCRFVGCSTTCLIINGQGGTAHRARIVSNIFVSNTGTNVIEVKCKTSTAGPASCLLVSNFFSSNACAGYLVDFTSATSGKGVTGWQISGNLFRGFDNGCLQIRGSMMNIAGNTFDGITKVGGATGVQRAIYWARNGYSQNYSVSVVSGNVLVNCQVPFKQDITHSIEFAAAVVTDNLFYLFDVTYAAGYQLWGNNVYGSGQIDGQNTSSLVFNGGIGIAVTFANVAAAVFKGWPSGSTSTLSRDVPYAQSITAAATALLGLGNLIELTSDNNYTLTGTGGVGPTLADGTNGAIVCFFNAGAFTITIQDQGTLALSNLRLSANTIALGPRDSIQLMFDAVIGDWIQIAQVNVL